MHDYHSIAAASADNRISLRKSLLLVFIVCTFSVISLLWIELFFRKTLLIRLKNVFLQREILLKSVDFGIEKHLKSVDYHAVQEDYILHRRLPKVRY